MSLRGASFLINIVNDVCYLTILFDKKIKVDRNIILKKDPFSVCCSISMVDIFPYN